MIDQLRLDGAAHQRASGHLLDPLVVGLTGHLQQGGIVDRFVGFALGADAAGEFRSAADGAPLVVELPRGHRPAAVDLSDDGVVAQFEAVEELLAELVTPVDLLDAAHGDAGALNGYQEHRQALVLGHVPVGTGQQESVVRGECAGAPRLCAVDHPFLALAVGACDDTGEVRSAAGFRQQLHQHLVAPDRGRNMLPLLLFAAGVEDRRGADCERRRVENDRHLVVAGFSVERLLVFDRMSHPAVFAREADAGESALVELLLEFAGPQPRPFLAPIGVGWVGRVDARQVVGQPRPGALGELRERFGGIGAHRCRLGHEADSSSLVSA